MYRFELHPDRQSIDPMRQLWNHLALVSGGSIGCHQLEVLESFCQHLGAQRKLTLITVRDQSGQVVGGLPLISTPNRLITGYQTVSNEWFQARQPLIADDADLSRVAQKLVEGMSQLQAKSFWLDWIAIDDPVWRAILSAAEQQGWAIQMKARFEVGITHLPATWQEFEISQSKNSRKRCRSEWKQISQAGQVRLQVATEDDPDELYQSLELAFQIELESWKGKQQSAIACQPETKEFYSSWASRLHRCGSLRLFLLRLDDQAIAFDLGVVEGDRYRSVKVSYKESHMGLSPGHVLNQMVFQHFIADGRVKIMDTVGPMNDANRRWSNDSYRMGRLILAPGTWANNVTGRSLVSLLNARAAWTGSGTSILSSK